jgi:hypothetical protein
MITGVIKRCRARQHPIARLQTGQSPPADIRCPFARSINPATRKTTGHFNPKGDLGHLKKETKLMDRVTNTPTPGRGGYRPGAGRKRAACCGTTGCPTCPATAKPRPAKSASLAREVAAAEAAQDAARRQLDAATRRLAAAYAASEGFTA